MVDGIDLPFDDAIRFFRDKANVTTRSWTDVYAAAHSRAFMVAGAATDALVADFRREIAKALETGTTLADFRDGFDDIVAKHGWLHTGSRNWRSRIIFETNLTTAYGAGRYTQLTQPDTLEAFPFWTYNHSGSLHPRKEHLAWDGQTWRADDPVWGKIYPPNGWKCGCFVTPCSHADLKRQGKKGPDEAPELLFRAEQVGGRRVMVPFGVDPGFEYNPGREWLSRTSPGSETVAASAGLIARFVESAVAGKRPGASYIPVALAPRRLARSIGVTSASEMRLSADTIRAHLKHGRATPEIYGELVEMAASEAQWFERPDGRISGFVERDGEIWMVGIKRSALGEIYVTTVHPSNAGQKRRQARVGRLIAGRD